MSVMLNEFLDAPNVVREVITRNKKVIAEIAEEFKRRGITNITTVARGTSDNAATYFKYIVEAIGHIIVSKFTPSITTVYGAKVNLHNNMLLAVSQSGMSTDTLMVAQNAKDTGAMTVAVTNDPNSPLAKLCDYHVYLAAGQEQSVGATKTFLAQLSSMYLLSNALSPSPAKMNIAQLPPILENFIQESKKGIQDFAESLKDINNFIILTRGLTQAVASELSLKMMTTCYKLSRPFSTCDFMHGPISIVEEGTPVIILAPDSEFTEEFVAMTTRLSLLGANVYSFTDIQEIQNMSKKSFKMLPCRGTNSPFLYSMAIELFVVYMAQSLGINPDTPRNAKKITITK
ncbi:MAG: SIS domain-containing protein [Clostridiales bacterium]|jgi:glucosamine--fructose-6-phosphate aminotransferase (isomerizing)|nr:SIS domain-containing protein [Clostridiales bacterium]